MKTKNSFTVFIVFALIIALFGAFPAGTRSGVSPMLEKGPQAQLAQVSSASNPAYGLFTCQVGLTPFTCYDPYQIRHAYGMDALISAGYTGKGKTIIIIDAFQSPTLVSDLNFFDTFYGLPGLNGLGNPANPNLGTFTQIAPDGLTPFDPNDANMEGWAGEITLDVLWAHAIAPGANITLVLAKTNDDANILSATKYAVDNSLGDVISQSFGEAESCMDPTLLTLQHQIFANATKKNITLFASSGDDGAAQPTCDGASFFKAASTPASDPLVTAVGGTELHAAGYCFASLGCDPSTAPVRGTYQGEIAWNEFDGAASGGGFSVLFDQISYQNALVGGKQQGVPDVAYSAAIFHGVLVFFQGDWFLFGGTSAGSPQWAALTAIADQAAGHNLGFINSSLYKIAQTQSTYASTFHDVTSGNNSNLGVQGFDAKAGWDAVTGLGSPYAVQMVQGLIANYSSGAGNAVISNSKPHTNNKPNSNGHMSTY